VVGIDVDDQHPLAAAGQGGGGDGHVVQQAEAHGPPGGGVVARRPHGAEGGVGLAGAEAGHRLETGAGGQGGSGPRPGAGGGVAVDPPAAPLAQMPQGVEVAGGVDRRQLVEGGRAGLDGGQDDAQPERGGAPQHGPLTLGLLGVAWDRIVLEGARRAHQQHPAVRHGERLNDPVRARLARLRLPAVATPDAR